MSEKIERGKQQVLFNYLPGKTFDFGKKSVIAKIEQVRGLIFDVLNKDLIITKIAEQVSAWHPEYRPNLRNEILQDESRFVIINPNHVSAKIYPLVFWCSNINCKKVFDYTANGKIPTSKICPRCKTGKLTQLRFVKIHNCGHLEPLTPPRCKKCNAAEMALDDRGSERISSFKWRCLKCNHTQPLFRERCRACTLPSSYTGSRNMDIEVFRASRTFYVHTSTLINIPQRKYDKFFNLADWYAISTAKYLSLDALDSSSLFDFANTINTSGQLNSSVSEVAFGELFSKLKNGEITVEQYSEAIKKAQEKVNPTIDDLKMQIVESSGIPESIWENSKYAIIDSVIPFELGTTKNVENHETLTRVQSLGVADLKLIDNFPIIIASYGYSRGESTPDECQLNPFPPDKEQGGKYPIYVDGVQADAILFRLDPIKVINWLRSNGCNPILPVGSNSESLAKGYFVQLFNNVNVYNKVFADQPEVRLVLSLIHTFSHIVIRHAALLCGLDKTSISEYIIPKTLSFSLYCNHRFGATIGALTALFEQSIVEWLELIESEKRCVYDPVCNNSGGNCHSCTHLAETSCKLFNQNLGRIYLFGGYDNQLERQITGYFN